MDHPQLHPLQVNPNTGEPYLRLASPLENIIITPPRLSDAPAAMTYLNDPNICRWLQGPPYPYLQVHADSWLSETKRQSDAVLQELMQASKENPDGPMKIVGDCPVRALREVKEDGTELFIGDIGFRRCEFQYEEPEVQEQLVKENERREIGDPQLVWCVGDYLASSHHGRGIMTEALRTLLTAWAIPRMGMRRIRAEALEGNIGSVRIFEKNGFVLTKTVKQDTVNSYGETVHASHVLWWDYS